MYVKISKNISNMRKKTSICYHQIQILLHQCKILTVWVSWTKLTVSTMFICSSRFQASTDVLYESTVRKRCCSWPAAIFTFDFLPMYVWANQSESIAFRFAIIWPWKTHRSIVTIDTRLKTHWFLLILKCMIWSRPVKSYSNIDVHE